PRAGALLRPRHLLAVDDRRAGGRLSSANKYSLIGSLRAAGQLIAYELPLVLSVVGVVILAGTMNLDGIVQAQIASGIPYVVPQFVGFVVFFIAALAELSRIPFDMPVAESELVMGYM